jgi:hypothetical protein
MFLYIPVFKNNLLHKFASSLLPPPPAAGRVSADFLKYYKSKGDVLIERRGKTEDRLLKKEYLNIYESGTISQKPDFFTSTLSTSEIKLKTKSSNIAGLQVADLLIYPCKTEILFENGLAELSNKIFGNSILECLKEKYGRHPYCDEIKGYYKIFLP